MTDEASRENLTARQRALLSILVHEYTLRPEPISSRHLGTSSGLQLSSATIRNEMATLEEKGYIRAPHTSSGRIPTEKGYRYFVKHLLETADDLPRPSVEMIDAQFQAAPPEMDAWLQTATILLAQETQSAALLTEPRVRNETRFKHVQLISVQGRMVLMVLVLSSGYVHQQMLVMSEVISQELLSQASEALNRVAVDQTPTRIRELSRNLSTLAHEIGELTADALSEIEALGSRIIYQAGFSEILPKLQDQATKQALQVFEGQTELGEILHEMDDQETGTVRVIVAGEGRWEELSHLSMVLSRYGTGAIMGAIGVVGPPWMRYGKAISTVGYVAGRVSAFLRDAHRTDDVQRDGERDD